MYSQISPVYVYVGMWGVVCVCVCACVYLCLGADCWLAGRYRKSISANIFAAAPFRLGLTNDDR